MPDDRFFDIVRCHIKKKGQFATILENLHDIFSIQKDGSITIAGSNYNSLGHMLAHYSKPSSVLEAVLKTRNGLSKKLLIDALRGFNY